MKRFIGGVAAAAVLALALSACTHTSSRTSDGGEPYFGNKELSIGTSSDVTSWDPAETDVSTDGPYLSAVYDPLVTIDSDGKPHPALAVKWAESSDLRTLTLTLRDGVTFSDGEDLDADAVVENLDHLRKGETSGPAYEKVKDVTAIADDIVQIVLTERDDTLLYSMGLGYSDMASPNAIEAAEEGDPIEKPVGSGPYTLADSTELGSTYRFEKIPDHWASRSFPFDPLTISPVEDPALLEDGLDDGRFNLISAGPEAIDRADDEKWSLSRGIQSWVGLQFNARDGRGSKPLGSFKVRQALNHAFDGAMMLARASGKAETETVLDLALYGYVTDEVFPAWTGPNGLRAHREEMPTSMATAKKLLAEAGYANGFDVTMPMSPSVMKWMIPIEETFTKLNIRVTWDEVEDAAYDSSVGDYPMFIADVPLDANPVAALEHQILRSEWFNPNPALGKYPKVRAQAEKAIDTDRGIDQTVEFEKLDSMIMDEAWFCIWYQKENAYVSMANFEVDYVTGVEFPGLRHVK